MAEESSCSTFLQIHRLNLFNTVEFGCFSCLWGSLRGQCATSSSVFLLDRIIPRTIETSFVKHLRFVSLSSRNCFPPSKTCRVLTPASCGCHASIAIGCTVFSLLSSLHPSIAIGWHQRFQAERQEALGQPCENSSNCSRYTRRCTSTGALVGHILPLIVSSRRPRRAVPSFSIRTMSAKVSHCFVRTHRSRDLIGTPRCSTGLVCFKISCEAVDFQPLLTF